MKQAVKKGSEGARRGSLSPGVVLLVCLLTWLIPACSGKMAVQLDPESKEFYNYARHLFTREEARIFSNLVSAEDRARFIENFWQLRDPNPETEINEFKQEIESRYEFARKYLREGHLPGWNTDRGRIFIVLGPPAYINSDTMVNAPGIKGYIHWYYGLGLGRRLFIRFIDRDGFGIYSLDARSTSLELLDALEDLKYQLVNKDDMILAQAGLKFSVDYLPGERSLLLSFNPDKVTFEEKGELVRAKFKINLVVYKKNNEFTRFEKTLTPEYGKKEVVDGNNAIQVKYPLDLEPGAYKLDVLVYDMYGERAKRKFVNIKVKN